MHVQAKQCTRADNGLGFNLAWGTLFFFLISAVFHLLALVFGLFESTWSWYWRQIDDAFCWWRCALS